MQSCWTFVSNHALVLAALHENPDARQRDIADDIGITQGAVQRILHDLVDSGHIGVERVGRRNHYHLNGNGSLRHPKLTELSVDRLLSTLTDTPREHPVPATRSNRNEHAA